MEPKSINVNTLLKIPFSGLGLLTGICGSVILLSIGQDFISSTVKDGVFYLSESALYKINWILFLPILVCLLLAQKKTQKSLNCNPWLLLAIPILSLVHILLGSTLIHFISYLFFDHTYGIFQAFRYFFVEEIYLILLGYLITFLVPLYHRGVKKENLPTHLSNSIDVRTKNGITRLSTNQITHISAERPYIAIHSSGLRYLDNRTLKTIAGQLDPSIFIRIHRSIIVNIRYFQSLESRGNGDYDLQLSSGETLRLSRNYVSSFRSAMPS